MSPLGLPSPVRGREQQLPHSLKAYPLRMRKAPMAL